MSISRTAPPSKKKLLTCFHDFLQSQRKIDVSNIVYLKPKFLVQHIMFDQDILTIELVVFLIGKTNFH